MRSLDSANESSLNSSLFQFGHSVVVEQAASRSLPAADYSSADYQALLAELEQTREQEQEQRTRIYHLEQALDQALACLEDLRSQIQDQTLLENQLASTEDYASVQQQAIARLKSQLAELQQALEAQILETQQRDQAIQELLATIEGMTQAQHREVERLRSRLVQDQREVETHRSRLGKHLHDLQAALESRQHRVSELEAETLSARTLSTKLQSQLEVAQQQIKELSTRLSQHRSQLVQLEAQLEQSQGSGPAATTPTAPEAPAQPRWKKAPSIEELENRLAQQLAQQARWQQHQHELEADRDRLQHRVTDLEQHVAEMQEQILRQAKQESEYETAVQYWKDQYLTGQQQINQLKEIAEKLLQSPSSATNPLIAELVQLLQLGSPHETPDPLLNHQPIAPLALPRLTTVELPEFLVRRRAAQKAKVAEA